MSNDSPASSLAAAAVVTIVGIAAAVAVLSQSTEQQSQSDPPAGTSKKKQKGSSSSSSSSDDARRPILGDGGALEAAATAARDWMFDMGRAFGLSEPARGGGAAEGGRREAEGTGAASSSSSLTPGTDDSSDVFSRACDYVSSHINNFSLEEQVYFYGCYKQATVGDCDDQQHKPVVAFLPARRTMKWEAWASFKGISKDSAKCLYVERLLKLVPTVRHYLYQLDMSDASSMPDCSATRTLPKLPQIAGVRGTSTIGTLVGDADDETPLAPSGVCTQEELKSLRSAVHLNDIPTVERLLKENPLVASVAVSHDRTTSLHVAADRGHIEILKLLCDVGADAHARDAGGDTALHSAVVAEQKEAAAFLLKQAGCDPAVKNEDGEDCFYLANLCSSDAVRKLLADHAEDAAIGSASSTAAR